MTNEKHTPGPWVAVGGLDHPVTKTCGVKVKDENGSVTSWVALCHPLNGTPKDAETVKANAQLIARAPDLLAENEELQAVIAREQKLTSKAMNESARLREALERLTAQMGDLVGSVNEVYQGAMLSDIEAARAALAGGAIGCDLCDDDAVGTFHGEQLCGSCCE